MSTRTPPRDHMLTQYFSELDSKRVALQPYSNEEIQKRARKNTNVNVMKTTFEEISQTEAAAVE